MNEDQHPTDNPQNETLRLAREVYGFDCRAVYEFAYSQYRRDFQSAYRILLDYREGRIRSIHSDVIQRLREKALHSYLMGIGLPPYLAKVLS